VTRIIQINKSVIPACDVDLETFKRIVRETGDLDKIGGYKIPAKSGRKGWETWVKIARENTDKPLIYDHQKAGTDIPYTGASFMEELKEAGFDAVILFPESGPVTQYEWTIAAQKIGLGVIVGGEMTHPRYLADDFTEGNNVNYTEIFRELGFTRGLSGFIRGTGPEDMYELAARMGVTDFVVPGNKPDSIKTHRRTIELTGVREYALYAPGFVAQGGEISEGGKVAGDRFHAIVGRGIYRAENMREAAEELISKL